MSDNKETKQALAVIEAIASQWDGCMFPGIGHDIDIGASIRDAWKRLYEQAPAVEAGARDERAALIAERDAAIMSTHRQALCIQQCAAHIGPETSATIDGLPLAVKRVVRERDEALAALDGTPWQKDRASESAATDPTRERIAQALHYPDCWDTAAYPTLESAVWESVACAKLGCSECGGASEAAAGGKSHASDCAVHNEPAYPNGPCDCGVALREEAAQLKALANELRIEGLSELAAREPVAEVVIGWDASRPKTVKLLRAGEVLPIGTKLAAAPQPPQAGASADKSTKCTCGDPSAMNVLHRADGPCYHAAPAASAVAPSDVRIPMDIAVDARRMRTLCRLLDAMDDLGNGFPGEVHAAFQEGGARTRAALDAAAIQEDLRAAPAPAAAPVDIAKQFKQWVREHEAELNSREYSRIDRALDQFIMDLSLRAAPAPAEPHDTSELAGELWRAAAEKELRELAEIASAHLNGPFQSGFLQCVEEMATRLHLSDELRNYSTQDAAPAEPKGEQEAPDIVEFSLFDIAQQCARNSKEQHAYLPHDAPSERAFTPHSWVLDAMRAAVKLDRKMNRGGSQNPTLYQYRTKPTWDGGKWSEWEECSKASAKDYIRVPLLHGWAYEVRELYAEPKAEPIYQSRLRNAPSWTDVSRDEYEACRAKAEQQAALTLDFATRFTPFGMLVRALRIVAGTTLYDMAKALLTTPAKLSAIEFGRSDVTPEFAFDVAAYFDALGVRGTLDALNVAAAKGDGQ